MITAATGYFVNDQLRIMLVIQRYHPGSYNVYDAFSLVSYDPWTLEKEIILEGYKGSVQSLNVSHFVVCLF